MKPLIPQGGTIVLDLTDVDFMDSLGLGTLVGLKVSAIHQGYCMLELVNLTPRIAGACEAHEPDEAVLILGQGFRSR